MDFPISRCSKKTTSITSFLKNMTDCIWVVNKQLSSGAQGQIFKVCCGSNDLECKYVMKSAQNNGENEIKMQYLFHKLGLAPKIVEAFICNEEVGKSRSGLPIFDYETYIVMEKKDFNAKDYIFYLHRHGAPKEFILTAIQELMYKTFEAIIKANSNKLWHNDKIIENIMLDFNPDGTFRNLVFIDFSFSKITKTPEEAKEKESYNELVMTFRLLLKNYLQKIDEENNLDNYWSIIQKNILERLGSKNFDEIKLEKQVLNNTSYKFEDFNLTNILPEIVKDEDFKSLTFDDEEDYTPSKSLTFDDEEDYTSPVSTPPSSPSKRIYSTPPQAPKRPKFKYGNFSNKRLKIEEIFY